MLRFITNLAADIQSGLAANFKWQLGMAIGIPILSALLFVFFIKTININIYYVFVALTVFWIFSGILAVRWFKNHTKHRDERMRQLASLMFLTDHGLNALVTTQHPELNVQHEPRVRATIELLLSGMCELLVYRQNSETKGATFLALKEDKSGFRLFAQVRHGFPRKDRDIESKLTVENSLAGQAIKIGKLIVLSDSRNPPLYIRWTPTDSPYIGRAVCPVQVVVKDHYESIGVLCFDTKRRLNLATGDREIMTIIADKIASLWMLSQQRKRQIQLD